MRIKAIHAISTIARTFLSHRIMYPINLALFHISLRGMGILNYENTTNSGEHNLLHRLARIKPKTIVEVGAHDGTDTITLHSMFPSAKIFAFEPHPGNYQKLKKATKELKNIKAFESGLGSKSSRAVLWDHAIHASGSQHATLSRDVMRKIHNSKAIGVKVNITTLDNIAKENKISQIDFLKIDTEGHELEVLNGAKSLINKGRISYIQLEFNSMNAITKVFLGDFMKLLKGYSWYRLLPRSFIHLSNYNPTEMEIFAYQNLLAISPGAKNITTDK